MCVSLEDCRQNLAWETEGKRAGLALLWPEAEERAVGLRSVCILRIC